MDVCFLEEWQTVGVYEFVVNHCNVVDVLVDGYRSVSANVMVWVLGILFAPEYLVAVFQQFGVFHALDVDAWGVGDWCGFAAQFGKYEAVGIAFCLYDDARQSAQTPGTC